MLKRRMEHWCLVIDAKMKVCTYSILVIILVHVSFKCEGEGDFLISR